MDYVAASIAFVAAIVGIIGGTWNPDAKGMRRVTATGWGVLVLASSALAVQVVQTHKKNEELKTAERTRKELAALAVGQVNQALVYTEDVFAVLYTLYRYKTKQEHQALDWRDTQFVTFLSELDMNSTQTDGFLVDGETWGHFISRQLARTHARLTAVLGIYAEYLDADTVRAVELLRTCELFQFFPDYNLFYRPPTGVSTLRGSHHADRFPSHYVREFAKAYRDLRARVAPSLRSSTAEPQAKPSSP